MKPRKENAVIETVVTTITTKIVKLSGRLIHEALVTYARELAATEIDFFELQIFDNANLHGPDELNCGDLACVIQFVRKDVQENVE